ncbi:MAG: hypothetical protein K6B43_08605 [Treponema sp.]|nr:hypothetical protein [Treponema sp.]
MKKTFINKTVAFASSALLLSLFASCSPEVEDTTANYAEKENAVTTTTGAYSHTAKGGSVSCNVSTILTASKDTQIAVSIGSYAKIDVSSVTDAINFYTLSDNSENKYYYPVRGSALGKDLLHTTEPSSYTSSYTRTTTFLFNVDTSSVTTDKIALVVDATKLKDRSGNAVLNTDDDDVAGEETDSYIDYITVSKKSDGTTETTALNNRFDEEFDKAYLSSSILKSDLKDDDGNLTGKIRFTVSAPKKSASFDEYGSRTWTYDDSLASSLASIYKLQTKAPNATAWSDVALSFTYHSDSDSTGVNPVSAHTYTADTSALSYGTQWRLVRTNITSGSAPSDYAKYYGHAGYFFYCGSKEYTEIVSFYDSASSSDKEIFTSTVYTASPVNIYAFGTTEAATTDFDATDDYTDDVASFAQNDLLNFSKTENGQWWVSLNDGEFESASDFIVTNANNARVDSIVNVVKGGDNRIIGVEIALKNKNVGGNYKVWVGNGTTLKSNPAYPTQKKFGVPADSSKGDVGGYVALLNFETVHDSASSDIDDFVLTNVESTEYIDYFVSLRADTLYTIQIANGYNNSSLVGACYCGAVSVTDLDGYTIIDNEYRKSSVTFTPAEDGVYKVRVRSKYSGYSGYVGFYIYEKTVSSVDDVAASTSISDYTLAQISSSNSSEDFYYTLEDGSYRIQLTNGYSLIAGDTLLSDSGNVPACYYGQVEVYSIGSDGDAENLQTVNYYDAVANFTVYTSGIYCIRIIKPDAGEDGQVYEDVDGTNENVNLYDGYVGFHIYKN